jgi:hypothetical protein
MNRLIIAIVAVACLVAPVSATAAPHATVQGLQRQVNTLKSQVSSLRNQLATANSRMVCLAALSTDMTLLVGYNVDLYNSAFAGTTIWTSVQPVDDRGACAAVGVSRTRPTPPSGLAFRALQARSATPAVVAFDPVAALAMAQINRLAS